MLFSQNQIEEAENILASLRAPGRLEILSMIQNRLLKMHWREKHSGNQDALSVIEDLLNFIEPATKEELRRLGEEVQAEYGEFYTGWDLLSLESVELDTRKPGEEVA